MTSVQESSSDKVIRLSLIPLIYFYLENIIEMKNIIWLQKIERGQPKTLIKNREIYRDIIIYLSNNKWKHTLSDIWDAIRISHPQQVKNYIEQMKKKWFIKECDKQYLVDEIQCKILYLELENQIIISKEDYNKLIVYREKYLEIKRLIANP